MKTKFYLISSLSIIIFLFVSCGDDEIQSAPFNQSINLNMDNFNNMITIVESASAHSGKKICHLDSGQNYGFYYTLNIPDSLIGKDLVVSIDSWVRTGKKDNKCGIICSVVNAKDSILQWQSLEASTVVAQPNEWANLNGNIVVPGNLMIFGSKVNVMCFNSQGASYFDVDDLKITYSEPEKKSE